MIGWISSLGRRTLRNLEESGRVALFASRSLGRAFYRPFRVQLLLRQMEFVGVHSIVVVLLTAVFTGMVLALQSAHGFRQFSAESMVGMAVALSMTRELGPVLTSIMVAARAGSAMAAELGTMRVTEQIDALEVMGVDPVGYLSTPRILATVLMVPVLTIVADLVGIAGGYFVGVKLLGINAGAYMDSTIRHLELDDIYNGLVKAAVFGFLLAAVSCYKGYKASGGAQGVGMATTEAVVVSCVLILVSDYFLTALMF